MAAEAPSSPPPLGIVAGGGKLPRQVAESCRARGREVFVVALEGQADPATVADLPHTWVRLGHAAKGLEALRKAGVRDIVMVGPVRRPSLGALRPDLKTAAFMARLGSRSFGDDGLLRAVMGILESEGFHVLGAHEVMQDLLVSEGPLGRLRPDERAEADIARGRAVLTALGPEDVGQGVVVQQGVVLGIEAVEGTDALLARCGELRRPGPGGVLVKLRKRGQDSRADLPTIGVHTVENAAAAGLRGLAIEAGGTIVVDPDATAKAADSAGLFVVALKVTV